MPVCRKCEKFSNCLTIDSCEHCGAKDWHPPTPPAASKSTSNLGCVAILVVPLVLIWFALPDSWTDPIRYSVQYGISTSDVHSSKKPNDCNFMTAPLGNKNCFYKKWVTGFNAGGFPVVTNDEMLDHTPPDKVVKRVEIIWDKVSQ